LGWTRANPGAGADVLSGVRVDRSFEDFVRARSTALLRTAYLLTGDRGHAEDLLQAALLRAARHWARAREAPDAYLRRVLVNLSHDRLRQLFRRPREAPLTPEARAGAATNSAAGLMPAGDPAIDRVTERSALVPMLARLPVRQRQVLVLRYFEDLSIEQTAQLLGCTTGAVKSYTARALSRLRAQLTVNADQYDAIHQLVEVPDAHR
jgi:RNA polymerase sigma-70 factor (sigma-E family)